MADAKLQAVADAIVQQFTPQVKKDVSQLDLSAALGWEVGEERVYTFFGIPVAVQCRKDGESYYCLHCVVYGEIHRQETYSSKYVEDAAQELAAVAVLKAVRDGRAALVEVQK